VRAWGHLNHRQCYQVRLRRYSLHRIAGARLWPIARLRGLVGLVGGVGALGDLVGEGVADGLADGVGDGIDKVFTKVGVGEQARRRRAGKAAGKAGDQAVCDPRRAVRGPIGQRIANPRANLHSPQTQVP